MGAGLSPGVGKAAGWPSTQELLQGAEQQRLAVPEGCVWRSRPNDEKRAFEREEKVEA